MIVWHDIHCHGRDFLQQFVKRRSVDSDRNVIAMSRPNGGLGVPYRRDRKNHRFLHRVVFPIVE